MIDIWLHHVDLDFQLFAQGWFQGHFHRVMYSYTKPNLRSPLIDSLMIHCWIVGHPSKDLDFLCIATHHSLVIPLCLRNLGP